MRQLRREGHPNAFSRRRWPSRLLSVFLVVYVLGIAGAVALRVRYLSEAHLGLEMPAAASGDRAAAATLVGGDVAPLEAQPAAATQSE
jgi:hypothetical protein